MLFVDQVDVFPFEQQPSDLKQFSVQIKQEKRNGVRNADSVSFLRYVELNYMGNSYRLLKSGQTFNVTINGIQQRTFFNGEVSLTKVASRLLLSTSFGLKIYWDGNHAVEVQLCDTYKSKVCGLCGNFDGKNRTNF